MSSGKLEAEGGQIISPGARKLHLVGDAGHPRSLQVGQRIHIGGDGDHPLLELDGYLPDDLLTACSCVPCAADGC